jgi:hypothetical protein
MTGFIRGLLGSRNKGRSIEVEAPKQVDRQPKESKEFFLDMNEARTYGNLEYMQTSKKVKRTFPKTVSQPEEMALIQEVSAMDQRIVAEGAESAAMPMRETPAPSIASNSEAAERRRTDTSMDMFRNMAKQIRK